MFTITQAKDEPVPKPDAVLQKARDKIWYEIAQYEQRSRNFRHDNETFLSVLASETGKYIDTGVAVIGRYEETDWLNRLGQTKFKYLKEINRSIDRPWIYIKEEDGYGHSRGGWRQYWDLHVPKNSKLKNVVAGLLMACDNSHPNQGRVDDFYLTHIAHERKWQFEFTGPKGKEVKEHWLSQCKNDPVFRICLGLTPRVSPHK